jgi:O-antigen/teichoic acid export membrane protein
MLDKKIVNSSFFFVVAKYLILLIGFLRTTFVAIILSKNNMGELVIVYLIVEYSSYLFSLGIPNSINLQTSIDKNFSKNLNYNNVRIKKYYSLFFSVIFLVGLIFYASLYLSSSFYGDYIKETITNNYNQIFIVILLFSIKSFCNMHNRLWENGHTLILSDLIFALLYCLGIIFLLGENLDNPINIILKIIIFSQICSIIASNIKFSFKHFISFDNKFLKKLLPLGILLMLQNMMELYFWGIDRLFISFYLSTENLASFHIAHTYGRGLMIFFAAITFLIYPRLITILSSKKVPNDEIKRIISKAFSISETILVLAFSFYITFVPYLMNLILKKYDNFFHLFSFILIGLIVKSLTFFPVTFLISRKKQAQLTLNSFVFLSILIFLYHLLYNAQIILKAEEFTIIAIIIFLFFSVFIYSWSMSVLGQKKIYLVIFNKFWRISAVLLISIFCFVYNIDQAITAIFVIIFILLIYWKLFLDNFKLIYSTVSKLYNKKAIKN